jgi:hypothetical protein
MLWAISGLAKETAEILRNKNDVYLAGLWKNNLGNDLLWYVESVADWEDKNIRENKVINRPWTAPSWSWASTGGGSAVKFIVTRYSKSPEYALQSTIYPTLQIKDAKCTPVRAGGDPTGAVAEGQCYLDIRIRLVSVMIHRPCHKWQSSREWTPNRYGKFLLYTHEEGQESHAECRPATNEPKLELADLESKLWVDPTVERKEMTNRYIFNNQPNRDPNICKFCAFLPAFLAYMKTVNAIGTNRISSRPRDIFMIVAKEKKGSANFVRVGLVDITSPSQDDREAWLRNVWGKAAGPETQIKIV